MMPGDVESSSGNFRYRFKMRSVIFSYLQAGIERGCYNHNLRTDFRRKPVIFHQTIWGGCLLIVMTTFFNDKDCTVPAAILAIHVCCLKY